MISCILLSAGKSERFGSPKALARIDEKTTVVEFVQNTLLQSNIFEIIVVLGAQSQKIAPHLLNHEKIKSVHNKDYNLGQTSSFKTGLRMTSPRTSGIMLLPVDCPLIKSTTINFIVQEFSSLKPSILIPAYKGKKGHPPLFNSKLKDQMLRIPDAQGLNEFQRTQEDQIQVLPVQDPAILQTFNTPKEFEEMIRNFK